MRKTFEVHIENAGTQKQTDLLLPATPYRLMDAVDKLCLREEDKIRTEIRQYHDYGFLESIQQKNPGLFELNLLAQRLSELNETERAAFCGLVQMDAGSQQDNTLPTSRLIDLACSTDCCQVAEGVLDDRQLGEFCIKNGLVPEAGTVPDEIYHLLNFEQIGRNHRQAEGGVFTQGGYVERHSAVHEVFQMLDVIPKAPAYTIRLEVSKGFFNDPDYDSGKAVTLDLPAAEQEMEQALKELDAVSWKEAGVRCTDCAVPVLMDMIHDADDLEAVFRIAGQLSTMGPNERLKYKAMLGALDCQNIDTALTLIDTPERYTFSPLLSSPADLAMDNLRYVIDKTELDLLLPHLNLDAYGQDLLAVQNAVLTDYGLIERTDGQPVQLPQEQSQEGGMTLE